MAERHIPLFRVAIFLAMTFVGVQPSRADTDPLPTEVEFRKLVAELKTAGEPTTWADLNPKPIPAENNGATHIRRALDLMKMDDPLWDAPLNQDSEMRLLDVKKYKLREVLRDLPAVLGHIERAMACGVIDWEVQYKSPAVLVELPFHNRIRMLANYLALAMSVHREEGDYRAVVRRIRETLFLSRSLHGLPFIISHLVSMGMDAMAVQAIEVFGPGMPVGNDGKSATADDLRGLIALLLDERSFHASLIRAWKGERVMQIETTELMAARKTTISALMKGIGGEDDPKLDAMAKLADHWVSGSAMLRFTAKTLAVTDAGNWIDATSRLPTEVLPAKEKPVDGMLARLFAAPPQTIFRQHFLTRANRRMGAVVLAARLYVVDNGGRTPDRLEALVPKYLPKVPLDPMSGGQPVQYVAKGDARYVYSVWKDGEDDGGLDERDLPNGKPDTETDRALRLTPR